jgi:hypothetical protein
MTKEIREEAIRRLRVLVEEDKQICSLVLALICTALDSRNPIHQSKEQIIEEAIAILRGCLRED